MQLWNPTNRLNPKPRNPKPQTLNPRPQTLNPKPQTLNPKRLQDGTLPGNILSDQLPEDDDGRWVPPNPGCSG